MKLGIELKGDFVRAHTHQLILVALGTSQLSDNLSQDIVLCLAKSQQVCRDQVVDSEYVGQLYVQCRLCPGKEVVELVNIKMALCVSDIDHCANGQQTSRMSKGACAHDLPRCRPIVQSTRLPRS